VSFQDQNEKVARIEHIEGMCSKVRIHTYPPFMTTAPHHRCPRCGTSLRTPNISEEQVEAECSKCGLGYVTASLVAGRMTNQPPPTGPLLSREALRRIRQQQRHDFLACDFDVYELDAAWVGQRWGAGSASWGEVVSGLTLARGIPGEAPWVSVETHLASRTDRLVVARDLVARLETEERGHEREAGDPAAEDPTVGWDHTLIDVESTQIGFGRHRRGDTWIALGSIRTLVVGILAKGIDPAEVRLVRADLDHYR